VYKYCVPPRNPGTSPARCPGSIMLRLLQPLFAIFATASDSKLRQMVEYLKAENEILRSKLPDRITLTAREKTRLIKFGSAVGSAIKNLVTIVSYRTFCRWTAAIAGPPLKNKRSTPARKPGRPRTPEDIRELVVQLARESGFGYTRILGELRKLGIRTISRSTVVNILKEEGIDPGPKRGEGSWDEFVKRHAATLWACDFVSVRTLTTAGFVDLYLLFFIHIGSRRVIVSNPTANPDAAWVAQQARNASMQMAEWGLSASRLIRDGDRKFQEGFDAVFEGQGTEVQQVGPRAPNMNAYAERWVQTLRKEYLDHILILGEAHLAHLVREFVEHYHQERPHQAKGNVPLCEANEDEPRILKFPSGEVKCRERLGGLLRHYYREAA
jgi:putative transposase